MSSAEESDGSSDDICPTCGDKFTSLTGVKIHHKKEHDVSISGEECTCKECGDTYLVRPAKTDRSSFCSTKCMNAWQTTEFEGDGNPNWDGGKVQFDCDYCGNTVLRKKADVSNGRNFCSTACTGLWKSENLRGEYAPGWDGGEKKSVCENCEVTYTVQQCREDSRFCSYKCRGEWHSRNIVGKDHPLWKEKSDKIQVYGSNWREVQEAVRSRDDGVCQMCNTISEDRAHNVHHIIPRKLFKKWSKVVDDVEVEDSNVLRNLITLCDSCHGRVENGRTRSPVPESHWRSE